jgi:hypothetical protein
MGSLQPSPTPGQDPVAASKGSGFAERERALEMATAGRPSSSLEDRRYRAYA